MIKDEQKQSCHPEVPEARQYGSHQELSVVAKEVPEARQYGSKHELSAVAKEVPEARQHGSKHELLAVAKVVPEAQQNSVILRERSDRRILSKIKGFFANAQNARAYCPIALKKRVAFTLAEVLITLGIIGVVAAVTIPMLVKDYQKQQWVNGLRVGVSIIQNAVKQMMADENVDYLASTEFIISECNAHYTLNNAQVQKCNQIFSKYFKIINVEPTFLQGSACDFNKNGFRETDKSPYCSRYDGHSVYTLANGMSLGFSNFGNGLLLFLLDVNGTKQGPNTLGRDVQLLYVTNNGVVTGSCDEGPCDFAYLNEEYQERLRRVIGKPIEIQSLVRDEYAPQNRIRVNSDACLKPYDRWYCATRLMNNGWKMDY